MPVPEREVAGLLLLLDWGIQPTTAGQSSLGNEKEICTLELKVGNPVVAGSGTSTVLRIISIRFNLLEIIFF